MPRTEYPGPGLPRTRALRSDRNRRNWEPLPGSRTPPFARGALILYCGSGEWRPWPPAPPTESPNLSEPWLCQLQKQRGAQTCGGGGSKRLGAVGDRARSKTPRLGGYSRNPGDFRPRPLPRAHVNAALERTAEPVLALSSFAAENHCVLPTPRDPFSPYLC